MTAALAVFACVAAVALAAGYTGAWFAPMVLGTAARAAAPFVVVAVVATLLARRGGRAAGLATFLRRLCEGALLLGLFGWHWVEPHTVVAERLGTSATQPYFLGLAGAVAGALLALIERRFGRAVARVWLLWSAAFLILGGSWYAACDDIVTGRRLLALAVIVGVFGTLALAHAVSVRRIPRAGAPGVAALAALVAALAAVALPGPPAPVGPHDSVVLVVVDTLRADAVRPDRMPELWRIAGRGTRFRQAVSPAPWTLPATASLVGGWNPHRHHIGRMAGYVPLRGEPDALRLGRDLRDAGYAVAGFVNNPYLRRYYGFGLGFLEFRRYHGRASDGVALATDWLDAHRGRPSFVLLHLMDPHWPYRAPAGYGAPRTDCSACDDLISLQYRGASPPVRAEVTRRYWAEVAYTDAMLGRLVRALTASGQADHTWLVVTADHGEELWDHSGFLHGHTLYDELLRVPLVVVPPAGRGLPPAAVPEQVRLEDVGATLRDLAGLDPAAARDGRSLRPLLGGAASDDPRPVVAGYLDSPRDLRWAVRLAPFKAQFFQESPVALLFNLVRDPGENANLFAQKGLAPMTRALLVARVRALRAVPSGLGLDVHREPEVARPATGLDADLQRQLRSLGYLDFDESTTDPAGASVRPSR